MKCQKCKGLMVFDQVYDSDAELLTLSFWRCVNCGESVDPLIFQNRREKEEIVRAPSPRAA